MGLGGVDREEGSPLGRSQTWRAGHVSGQLAHCLIGQVWGRSPGSDLSPPAAALNTPM